MAELRINTTGKLSLFDADDSHAASIISGTVTANENVMSLATAGVTFGVPTITVGDATAEDTKLVFDGNAQDYHVGLDDSADTLVIGLGSTLGTTPAITINSSQVATFAQNPVFPDGGIAIADLDIDGGTDIGAAIVDADLFIIDDGAGGTNRKTAASRLHTYIAANTPAVLVTNSGDQAIATATNTLVTFDTETIDTDSAFASNTFTVPSNEGGMYGIFARGSMPGIDAGEFTQLRIYLNGAANDFFEARMTSHADDIEMKYSAGGFLNLSATNTIKMYWYQNSGDDQNLSTAALYIYKVHGA